MECPIAAVGLPVAQPRERGIERAVATIELADAITRALHLRAESARRLGLVVDRRRGILVS